MFYTFRYRTVSIPDIVEDIYIADADCLSFAVAEFKHFIRANYSSQPLVVSYFYLAEAPGVIRLGEFSERYYKKHFGGFQSV